MTLVGVVVDEGGSAVAGAMVEIGMGGISGVDAQVVATTAVDGTFAVRDCIPQCLVGARAAGYAASPLSYVQGEPGEECALRIVLRELGGVVEGTVVRADGSPVEGAVVRVGAGRTDSIRSTPMGAPALPAQVRSDQAGRFRAVGLPLGTQPLMVRDGVHAPWIGSCSVAPGGVTETEVVLGPGVTCAGTVRSSSGESLARVPVTSGQPGDFVELKVVSAADGGYRLGGLPPGEIELAARSSEHGKAKCVLTAGLGETLACDFVLSNGLELRGRVVDGDERGLGQVRVEARGPGGRWRFLASTDQDGRFVAGDQPEDRLLDLRFIARERTVVERDGIDPRGGELLTVLPRDLRPKAVVRGRVLAPDGRPVTGAANTRLEVMAVRYDPQEYVGGELQSDGAFTIEVSAGSWLVQLEASELPVMIFPARDLEAGEVWDLGTIQLERGGTLVVRQGGVEGASYNVFDDRGRFVCGLYNPDPPLRSELPGSWGLPLGGARKACRCPSDPVRSPRRRDHRALRRAECRRAATLRDRACCGL